jgi:hypothetical protein
MPGASIVKIEPTVCMRLTKKRTSWLLTGFDLLCQKRPCEYCFIWTTHALHRGKVRCTRTRVVAAAGALCAECPAGIATASWLATATGAAVATIVATIARPARAVSFL